MISISHMKALSKSKPTDVWCLDELGEHSMRFDRLSLCSQIKAIPIEDVVAMLTEIQLDIQEVNTAPQFLTDDNVKDFRECVDTIIQEKLNELKGNE